MFRNFDESYGKRIRRLSEELDKNMESIYLDLGWSKILHQENFLADLIKSYLERPKKPNQNLIEKLFVSAFTRSINRGDRVEDNPVIKLLIDKINIDMSVDSHPGEKLIHLASRLGKTKIVEALLKKGANINEKTDKGETPLHLALENYEKASENYHEYKDDIFSNNKSNQLEFIDFLIKNGSDLDIKARNGINARHIIAFQKSEGIFRDDEIKSLPNLLMVINLQSATNGVSALAIDSGAMNLQSATNGVSALAIDSGAMNSIEGAKVKQEPRAGGVEVKQEPGAGGVKRKSEPNDSSRVSKLSNANQEREGGGGR
jgi:hypothetical protein